jgi:hypothetical protein
MLKNYVIQGKQVEKLTLMIQTFAFIKRELSTFYQALFILKPDIIGSLCSELFCRLNHLGCLLVLKNNLILKVNSQLLAELRRILLTLFLLCYSVLLGLGWFARTFEVSAAHR